MIDDQKRRKFTLHAPRKFTARSMSMPDQSLSILLIAKAQYRVLESDSMLPGTVEKLNKQLSVW